MANGAVEWEKSILDLTNWRWIGVMCAARKRNEFHGFDYHYFVLLWKVGDYFCCVLVAKRLLAAYLVFGEQQPTNGEQILFRNSLWFGRQSSACDMRHSPLNFNYSYIRRWPSATRPVVTLIENSWQFQLIRQIENRTVARIAVRFRLQATTNAPNQFSLEPTAYKIKLEKSSRRSARPQPTLTRVS